MLFNHIAGFFEHQYLLKQAINDLDICREIFTMERKHLKLKLFLKLPRNIFDDMNGGVRLKIVSKIKVSFILYAKTLID